MSKERVYSIKINGLDVSISQVEALNRQLDNLEQRIDALSQKAINITADASVTSSSSGGGGRRTSELSEEAKLQKDIASTLEKAAQARSEEYKALLSAKEELKEYQTIAKAQQAQENLLANKNDLTTMQGMKAELHDIKAAMQIMNTDSEGFKLLTQQAAELQQKLKELEQAYGTFGRNVGNYSSAFDDLAEVTVKVGDTERTFRNATQASRQLERELKAMVINGKEGTEEYKELADAVHDFEMASKRAESAVNDLKSSSQGMDDMLDMFESFGALQSIGGGLKAFFGFDDAEIQKSIQSLVALQNVLKGIESLNQQMNTGEGLGKYFSGASKQVDAFTAKLWGAKVAEDGLVASTKAGTIAVNLFSGALKAIGMAGLMAAISLVVQGIQKLVGWIRDWIKGNADLVDSEKLVADSIKDTNEQLENRKKAIDQDYFQGLISDEERMRQQAEATNKVFNEQLQALRSMKGVNIEELFSGKAEDNTLGFDFKVQGLEESTRMLGLFDTALKENQDIVSSMRDHWDELTEAEKRMAEVGSTTVSTVSDTKDEFVKLSRTVGGQLVLQYREAMELMQTDTKKGQAALRELYEQLNNNDLQRAALFRLPEYFKNEQVKARLQELVGIIKDGMNDIKKSLNVDTTQLEIDALPDGYDKRIKQINYNEQKELAQYEGNERAKALVRKKYANQRAKAEEEEHKKSLASSKKYGDDLLEAEKQLTKLRIANMADGLSKRLAEIDSEYNIERNAILTRGKRTNELIAELDKKRANDRKKAIEESNKETLKAYNDLYDSIFELEQKNARERRELVDENKELGSFKYEQERGNVLYKSRAYMYDVKNAKNESVERDTKILHEWDALVQQEEALKKRLEELKASYDAYAKSQKGSIDETYALWLKGLYDMNAMLTKELAEVRQRMKEIKDDVNALQSTLSTNDMADDIEGTYEVRFQATRNYWAKMKNLNKLEIDDEEKLLKKQKDHELKLINDADEKQFKDIDAWYKKEKELAIANGEDLTKIEEKKQTLQTTSAEQFAKSRKIVEAKYDNDLKKLQVRRHNDTTEATTQMYSDLIQEARDYTAAIHKLEESNNLSVGNSTFYNIGDVRKQQKKALKEYENGANKLKKIRQELEGDYQIGSIDYKEYQQSVREIEAENENLMNNINRLTTSLKNNEAFTVAAQKVNEYVQMVGNAMNEFLSMMWDAQDAAYDKRMEDLQKGIDEQQELLDKQEEMTRAYAETVSSIEDELMNSRGARRQELIDQINAQMAAERASLAEERRIEKERKRMEEEQEREEIEQKKREQKRSIVQALINSGLAISNALTTTPFIPAGLIAAALATALGAAQVAFIKKQKYARGGRIEGLPHERGGVPVGNTGIEVEGREYIIRKESTTPNVQLLDYINRSKRKLTLEDFVDFYGKPSKVRQSIEKTKFADGGVLPLINTDGLSAEDRILAAMDRYAERPYYVSVTEIDDVHDRVGRVRAIAGL